MKIAIVHDYIKEYGGAERVLEELIKLYPDADVYASLYAPEYLGPHRKRFEDYKIHTSWFQKIPYKHKIISPLRLLAPFAFKSLDLSRYDIIIVSQTGAYFPSLVKKGKAKLICYTHTPPRYLYGYKTAREWKKNKFFYGAALVANHFLRIVDVNASKNVDQFVANSEEVASRIERFYRRDAVVIYPPVEIPNVIANSYQLTANSYYLTGGRLARAKGIDIIIDAFIKNKKQLKVFGKGFAGYEEELKQKADYSSSEARSSDSSSSLPATLMRSNAGRSLRSNNIEFVGEVTDEKKFELMAGAKAFVFASFDEDFGITPVEAMGVGTPVIAFRSGGVKETVVEDKTGVFYDENTPESLNKAIEKLEGILNQVQDDKLRNDCVERAEKFSEKEFDRKIMEVVQRA